MYFVRKTYQLIKLLEAILDADELKDVT